METWTKPMEAIATTGVMLSANSPETLQAARNLQHLVESVEQVQAETEHCLHAGMYSRTIRVPAGMVGVGVRVKVPTLLVVCGDVQLLVGDEWMEICGYAVLQGCAGRKQVFCTRSDVVMTMVFPTQAQSVDEAEREFTDEYETLMTRRR